MAMFIVIIVTKFVLIIVNCLLGAAKEANMDPFPVIIMLVTLAAIIWATYLVFRKNPEDGEGQQDDSSEGTNAAGKAKQYA